MAGRWELHNYIGLYENVLANLIRGLRDAVPIVGQPVDMTALMLCYDRRVQLMLEYTAATTVSHAPPNAAAAS